ncbi:MAG: restriction endonuclease subunit S [Desulfobacteraceae bacterium]|jgi:restriction endonuclease S subunit
MKLKDISDIHSGYITRGKIQASVNGSHYLLQAKDVDGGKLSYRTDDLIRFHAALSRTDRCLESGDLIFMARGAHNFTIQLGDLPEPALAAACFFIVRTCHPRVFPGYLCWYLNQVPVERYLVQHSGRGVHMPVVRRAVLENIQVPLPSMDTQRKIAEMNALLLREMDLLQRLGRKRKDLIAAACLQALRNC